MITGGSTGTAPGNTDEVAPVLGPAEQRVVDALLACIARWGVSKTTVEDVAREAGISRATIYRLFPGGKDVVSSGRPSRPRSPDSSPSSPTNWPPRPTSRTASWRRGRVDPLHHREPRLQLPAGARARVGRGLPRVRSPRRHLRSRRLARLGLRSDGSCPTTTRVRGSACGAPDSSSRTSSCRRTASTSPTPVRPAVVRTYLLPALIDQRPTNPTDPAPTPS
jgi:hypothetical protein